MSRGRLCPNHRIRKRVGRAGGSPGCPGRLELRLHVAVSVPLRSWGPPGAASLRFEDVAPARVRKSGVRVGAAELRSIFGKPGLWDICCSHCAYSYRRLLLAAKPRKRGR